VEIIPYLTLTLTLYSNPILT